MIQRITVGLQQKIGRPNFGSIGASCQVELTLDPNQSGDAIRAQVREAFACCRRRIEEELARDGDKAEPPPPKITASAVHQQPAARSPRRASDAQVRALHAIAAKSGIVLASELETQFGTRHPGDLTIRQASQLIDRLKSLEAAN